jgi:hypothetical protein
MRVRQGGCGSWVRDEGEAWGLGSKGEHQVLLLEDANTMHFVVFELALIITTTSHLS